MTSPLSQKKSNLLAGVEDMFSGALQVHDDEPDLLQSHKSGKMSNKAVKKSPVRLAKQSYAATPSTALAGAHHLIPSSAKQSSLSKVAQHQHYQVTYEVNFRVRYHAEPGYKVIVIGSIPELDEWRKPGPHSHFLRRNGDVWESVAPLVTRTYFFHYKYAIVKDNYLHAWERGVDRVADLEIMASTDKMGKYSKSGESFNPCEYFFGMEDEQRVDDFWGHTKPIQLNETWEKLWVSFMVFHQALDPQDALLFTCDHIGVHKRPMKMMQREFKWMSPKYGTSLRPYEISCEFDNKDSAEGQFKSGADSGFQYYFTVRSRYNPEVSERAPMRWIDLQDPNKYRGTLGSSRSALWLNTDRVWNVNGAVFKADGNFLNHFFFQRIGETPISVGSYPTNVVDFQRLRSHGATAVLNIMDAADHRMHSVTPDNMRAMCHQGGINVYHHAPVSDMHLETYCQTAFQAILQLHKLVNEQHRDVFINCAAGVSRSSTIWIAFIALFGLDGIDQNGLRDAKGLFKPNAIVYKNIDHFVLDLATYLKTYHGLAMPNLEAVHAIIDKNKDYVEEQRRRLAAEEARRRRAQEEKDRLAALKKAQEEYDNARRIRLREAEEERVRAERWEANKEDRDRRDQHDLGELERTNRRKLAEEEERLRQKEASYERSLEELRRRYAEEEAMREHERRRLQQECLLQEEKVRLQKLAIEAARDAARIKKEQEAMEETERKGRNAAAKEEAERRRREREIKEEEERHRKRLSGEEEERRRLEGIRLAQHQAEQLKIEITAQEEQQLLVRRKVADEEEGLLAKERQSAREEAARLTERLKQLDIESNLSARKRQIKDWTSVVAKERLAKFSNLKSSEFKNEQISTAYRLARTDVVEQSVEVGDFEETPAGGMYLESSHLIQRTTPEQPYDFTMEELIGLTDDELNAQAVELFSETPIAFIADKTNALDLLIQECIEDCGITVPVVHIRDTTYLVGPHRMQCATQDGTAMIWTKGKLFRFRDYVLQNEENFQRQLVTLMIKSGESLEYVVDQIIQGKPIRNIHAEQAQKQKRKRIVRETMQQKKVVSQIAKAKFAPVDQSVSQSEFNEAANLMAGGDSKFVSSDL